MLCVCGPVRQTTTYYALVSASLAKRVANFASHLEHCSGKIAISPGSGAAAKSSFNLASVADLSPDADAKSDASACFIAKNLAHRCWCPPNQAARWHCAEQ